LDEKNGRRDRRPHRHSREGMALMNIMGDHGSTCRVDVGTIETAEP
jgi:hypothetical protein